MNAYEHDLYPNVIYIEDTRPLFGLDSNACISLSLKVCCNEASRTLLTHSLGFLAI